MKINKQCEVCGTSNGYITGKNGRFGKDLCTKHYNHMVLHGKILEKTIYDKNEIIIDGDIAKIIMCDKDGNEAGVSIVDKESLDTICKYKWSLTDTGYAICSSKRIRMHRLLAGNPSGLVVDHINHNKLDNRKLNLRVCTPQENSFNTAKKSSNTSGIIGVRWNSSKKSWSAEISINGKGVWLGRYKDKSDAIKARLDAEERYFGEFSLTNSMDRGVC